MLISHHSNQGNYAAWNALHIASCILRTICIYVEDHPILNFLFKYCCQQFPPYFHNSYTLCPIFEPIHAICTEGSYVSHFICLSICLDLLEGICAPSHKNRGICALFTALGTTFVIYHISGTAWHTLPVHCRYTPVQAGPTKAGGLTSTSSCIF